MGLRGPGAGRGKAARDRIASQPKRDLPWEAAGLDRVGRVVAFLEFLPITKGPLHGTSMRLLPEQRRFVERVYGPVGKDRVRVGLRSEPKGNGKTGLGAGLALCHLLGPEAEPRGEVYSGSIDRNIAAIIFAEMEAIIEAVPEFAVRVNVIRFHKRIEVLSGVGVGSVYEALSSDARTAHGKAPNFWIYDELAQARDGELLENLIASAGKRAACLGMVLSTQAATDDHPLSVLIDDAANDPHTVVMVHSAPANADPFDPEVIRACNPAAGVFLDFDDLVIEAERARRNPIFEARFRNLRLNQRIDAEAKHRIVPIADWKACETDLPASRLDGRRCYGGLDLSGKHDLTALVLAFPDDEAEQCFDLLAFFWTPLGQMANRQESEQAFFRVWIDQGAIIAVPGQVIRYRYMARQIRQIAAKYDVRAIGYDRWRIDDFKGDMSEEGIDLPLVPFGQGYKDMAPAIDLFARELVPDRRIRQDGNPVMNAAISTAIVTANEAGEMKVDKGKSNDRATVRIDGLLAALMALGTAKRMEAQPGFAIEAMIA